MRCWWECSGEDDWMVEGCTCKLIVVKIDWFGEEVGGLCRA